MLATQLSTLCPSCSAYEAFSAEHSQCVAETKSLVVQLSATKELLFVPVYSAHGRVALGKDSSE